MCCGATAPLLQPGDVLTIGETPLAVIQGRYRTASWNLARCKVGLPCFHPTSSLATACGMQALIVWWDQPG